MKKIFKFSAIFAAVVVTTVSMAACGEDSGKETSVPAQQSSAVSQDESSKDDESNEEESSKQESSVLESSEEENRNQESIVPESGVEESSDIISEQSKEISLPEEHVLEYLFSTEQVKENVRKLEENMSNDTQTTTMTVEDDYTLAVTVTLKQQLDDPYQYYDYFKQLTDESADRFNKAVDDMKEVSRLDFLILIIRYNNADGSTIYEDYFFGSEDEDYENSTSESSTGEKPYADLDEFLSDPELQESLSTMAEGYTSQGYGVRVIGEDDTKLVYEFTLKDDPTLEETDELKKAVDSSDYVDNFERIATSVQNAISQQGISIVVRYQAPDGRVVAEREYFPGYLT